MALGRKTGGRKAGTPSRKTCENRRTLEVSPAQSYRGHSEHSDRPDTRLELRGGMNAEPARYVYPKRKAVEVAADQSAPRVPSKAVVQMFRRRQGPFE